jgi:hypothetical protein
MWIPRHLSEGGIKVWITAKNKEIQRPLRGKEEMGHSNGVRLINRSLILPYKEVGGLDGRKFSLTF